MPFAPRHDNHAIAEVAFIVTLAQRPENEQMSRFAASYEAEWKEELPIKDEITGQVLRFGNLPPNVPQVEQASLEGVNFRTLQRDGSLDWQVTVDGQSIRAHCGSYSRWANVWPTAYSYLERATSSFVSPQNPITSFGLQYIDEFVWDGDLGDYDAALLFDAASQHVLSHMTRSGPMWHLHQGWFEHEGLVTEGRRLEKIHIDAIQQKGQTDRYPTRIDTTLRHDLSDLISDIALAFGGEESISWRVFDAMHVRNKELLKSVLTEEMAERIGLNV